MWTDKNAFFADKAPAAGAIGRILLGDQYDLGVARDPGTGQELYMVAQFNTTLVGAGAFVQFELVSGLTAAIPTNGTATIHAASGIIPVANAIAGRFALIVALPNETLQLYNRFLGVILNISGAPITGGLVNAFLTNRAPVRKLYADGAR